MKNIIKCRICQNEMDITAFKKSKRKKSGYETICKKCHVQQTLMYRKSNRNQKTKKNYLIKYCKKHGNLEYKDIGLNIYKDTNPIVVDMVCLKCLNIRTFKKYNENNIIQNIDNKKIICYLCSNSYFINDFYKSELKRKSPLCAKCVKEKHKPYKEKSRLKINFNLSIDQYNQLLIQQDYKCKICLKPETHKHRITKETTNLAIDHCHKTGKIRGLLCRRCNLMLGNALDSIELLKRGVAYLES